MKIAFVVGHFPVLAETPFLNQITGLIDQGYKVHIFSFERGDTKKMHSDIQKYGLLEKTTYLDPLSFVSHRIRDARLALDENFFKKMGFRLPSLELLRYIRDLILPIMLVRSSRLKNMGPYDIIHCQMGTVGLRFLPLRRIKVFRGKLIVQFRGEDVTEYVRHYGERVYQELFKKADLFLPVCEYLGKKALSIGCPREKIYVLGSGIDCNRFRFRKRSKSLDGKVKIAIVGRMVEKKGTEYAIRAISILKRRGLNVELLVIGDGLLKPKLMELSKELNIINSVRFLGARNHNEIARVLESSHLFVAPSVTSWDGNEEGIPNVLKEAMAVGLPVVSTYHAGIPELVADGVSGFLVPERDPQALAEKLAYLIDHPKLWEEMGRAGRQFVEKNYDKEKLNRELVDIYNHVVS